MYKHIKTFVRRIVEIFLIFLLITSCSTTWISYGELSFFTSSQLDSTLHVRSLPDLSSWKESVYILSDGSLLHQWYFIESLQGKKSEESIYTVEQRDSLYRFIHKVSGK